MLSRYLLLIQCTTQRLYWLVSFSLSMNTFTTSTIHGNLPNPQDSWNHDNWVLLGLIRPQKTVSICEFIQLSSEIELSWSGDLHWQSAPDTAFGGLYTKNSLFCESLLQQSFLKHKNNVNPDLSEIVNAWSRMKQQLIADLAIHWEFLELKKDSISSFHLSSSSWLLSLLLIRRHVLASKLFALYSKPDSNCSTIIASTIDTY